MTARYLPKNRSIIDPSEITHLVNMYNEYVDSWNKRELDRTSSLQDRSMFKLTTVGVFPVSNICFQIDSEQFSVRHESKTGRGVNTVVSVSEFTPYYWFKMKKGFHPFHPGWSFLKNMMDVNQVLSVKQTYMGGDGVRTLSTLFGGVTKTKAA